MPFMAQSVFPIIKIMQTYLKLFHLTSLQRKAILYLAIMTHKQIIYSSVDHDQMAFDISRDKSGFHKA